MGSGIIQQTLSTLPNGLSNPNLKNTSHPSSLSHPSVTIPAASNDGVGHKDTTPVVGSSMPTVGMTAVLPTLTTTATASVQTPPINITTSSAPTSTTTTSHTHTGVVLPGQKQQVKQVKHLIFSPHNQEALKKVHSQIQALQLKKSDQDAPCLQQLFAEYRKIMATGKHVTVTTSPQQTQIQPQPPSQPTPVRYSHPVGHKVITLTQFKQQIKHLPQDQQRQIMDQSKHVLQRWKEPTPVTTSGLPSPSITHSTTSPHVSPTAQNSSSTPVSRPSVSPVSNASMPIITTSTPSPTVPTTSTTVSTCTTSGAYGSFTKMAPPQCSPVSSTTSINHPQTTGTSPKSVVPSGMVLPPQTSPRFTSCTVNQEHSPVQVKSQPSPYITKDQLFEHQLKTDQNGALNPDYRTPFKNKIDACKRLIRYHVYSDKGPTSRDLTENDNQFEPQAESLLKKFSNMKYKYQSLLLKDSMRRHASSETVMLYRLFVQEDKVSLERDKTDVQSGNVLDLPPAPAHWLTGEPQPPDPPYPWELEWENQKAYSCTSWNDDDDDDDDKEEEEEEEELAPKAEMKQEELTKEDQYSTESKEKNEEKEKYEEKVKYDENEDFDDSQEGDSQLHIFMGDEEEEEDEKEAEEKEPQQQQQQQQQEDEEEEKEVEVKAKITEEREPHTPSGSSVKCSESVTDFHNNNSTLDTNSSVRVEGKNTKVDDVDLKQEAEQEQELVICDSDGPTSAHSSPAKCATTTSEHPGDQWMVCDENDTRRLSECSHSPLTNTTPSDVSKPVNSPTYEKITNDSYRDSHSPLRIMCSDKVEKDKRKEKGDKDKERRRSDKGKDKERGRDREKEDRPPKKLKRAVVPPLRIRTEDIRTEDKGVVLKLRLKKQEGSEDYYRVGEERKREYRVEQHEDEEEDDFVENVSGRKPFDGEEVVEEEDGDIEGGHGLKEVKVVLQDVLKDKKFKHKKHEEERMSKRRRRDRSDNRNDRSDRRNRNNYHWSNHSQQVYQTEGERNSSQQSNYDGRTWNHNSNAEWTRSGGSVECRRTSGDDDGEWQRTSGGEGHGGEWHRVTSEGASNVSHSSDNRSSREYSPHLLHYNEHHDAHEFSSRQNHSQSYGHSGSQSRNSHNYH